MVRTVLATLLIFTLTDTISVFAQESTVGAASQLRAASKKGLTAGQKSKLRKIKIRKKKNCKKKCRHCTPTPTPNPPPSPTPTPAPTATP